MPPPIGFQPTSSAPYPAAPPSYDDITRGNADHKAFQSSPYHHQHQSHHQQPQTSTQVITSELLSDEINKSHKINFFFRFIWVQIRLVVTQSVFGPNPMVVTCPSCHQQTTSKIEYVPGSRTHLWAVILCLLCWPLMCIPYCTDSCMNANHHCSKCGSYLGTFVSD